VRTARWNISGAFFDIKFFENMHNPYPFLFLKDSVYNMSNPTVNNLTNPSIRPIEPTQQNPNNNQANNSNALGLVAKASTSNCELQSKKLNDYFYSPDDKFNDIAVLNKNDGWSNTDIKGNTDYKSLCIEDNRLYFSNNGKAIAEFNRILSIFNNHSGIKDVLNYTFPVYKRDEFLNLLEENPSLGKICNQVKFFSTYNAYNKVPISDEKMKEILIPMLDSHS
jgi:hypothetical protein